MVGAHTNTLSHRRERARERERERERGERVLQQVSVVAAGGKTNIWK